MFTCLSHKRILSHQDHDTQQWIKKKNLRNRATGNDVCFFSWLWHPFWLALCLCSHPSTRGADCMTQRSSCLSLQESQQLNTCGCDLIFIMIFILWRNVFSDSPEACQINVSACLSVYVPPLPRLWQTPGDVAALGGKVRNAKPQSLCHTLWSDQK